MANTSSDLALAALEKLGLLGGGQDAPAEDVQPVKAAIPKLLEELANKSVVYVADPDDIDNAIFELLADRLAANVATRFEKPKPDLPTILALENELRRAAGSASVFSPARPDYF